MGIRNRFIRLRVRRGGRSPLSTRHGSWPSTKRHRTVRSLRCLRREGLFHSHVREWAATRDAGALAGLDRDGSASDRRQRRADQAEIDRLRAENQRLTGKLAQTQAALSIMGKAHELLESLAESSEPPSGSNR